MCISKIVIVFLFFSAVNKAVDLAVEFAVLDCNFKKLMKLFSIVDSCFFKIETAAAVILD